MNTRSVRLIKAKPDALYAAFMDPAALVEWLPPGGMTGKLHAFDGRAGGGYEMSLFYPQGETRFRGKTAEREDRVQVRFTALEPPGRIVQTVRFVTADPGLQGEMTQTITFEDSPGGTEVVLLFEDLPPGLKPQDNEAGAEISLEQLARYME